jgi:hypothetical protein
VLPLSRFVAFARAIGDLSLIPFGQNIDRALGQSLVGLEEYLTLKAAIEADDSLVRFLPQICLSS